MEWVQAEDSLKGLTKLMLSFTIYHMALIYQVRYKTYKKITPQNHKDTIWYSGVVISQPQGFVKKMLRKTSSWRDQLC